MLIQCPRKCYKSYDASEQQKSGYTQKSIAKIYGNILLNKGATEARETLESLRKDTLNYYLSENEMNTLGYDFIGNSNPYHLPEKHFYKQAVETLKTNVELFPNSWNVYDSYAEALLEDGQKKKLSKCIKSLLNSIPITKTGRKCWKDFWERKINLY
jgi:predicted Zn-dependent protease